MNISKNIFLILFFFISINSIFCQENKPLGGPAFQIYQSPQNVCLTVCGRQGFGCPCSLTQTLYLCGNQSFNLVFSDAGSVPGTCSVNKWIKNGVDVGSSNIYVVVDSGLYSVRVNMSWGGTQTLGNLLVKRNNYVMYKLPENIPIDPSSTTFTMCDNKPFQLKLVTVNSTTCNSYQWLKDDIIIPNETTNIYTVSDTGLYRINLSCTGCGNMLLGDYKVICPAQPTVPTSPRTNSDPVLFPNPMNDKLFVLSDNFDNLTITIYNAIGQIILTQKINDSSSPIDISNFNIGLYYISVNNGTTITKQKIIKNAH